MIIRLRTLGGLSAEADGEELDWLLTQRARAALLVYLAVEREVSRASLGPVFWPESEPGNARHALRQGLYHLRRSLGEGWLESRTHEVRITERVQTDVLAFENAIGRDDPAAAAALYEGPFLDGIHLVDTSGWERWVDVWRARCARSFRQSCREWLERERGAGRLERAVEVGERWVAADPLDDEAQHRFIQALAEAGERTEAIRQFEVYARALEGEGLWPLDETQSLVGNLRSRVTSLPERPPTPGEPGAKPPGSDSDAGAAQEAGSGEPPPPVGLFRPYGFPRPQGLPRQDGLPRRDGLPRPGRLNFRGRAFSLVAGAVAVALIGALAVAWGGGHRGPGIFPGSEPPPEGLAVFPFTVRGGEEVAYLEEGMVTLLSTALNGAGTIRSVDPRAVFAGHSRHGGGTLGPAAGSRLSTELDAGMFVLGDIVEAGGNLHIEAAVYDVDGASGVRSRASVNGGATEVFELVDRLAARLLGGMGDPSADRLLRTASVTTGSLPAFLAYLEGDRRMREGRLERAEGAFHEATAHDSTFALAHYRLALAREWAPLAGHAEAAEAAGRHAERLSARDRELLEAYAAWRRGEGLEAERRYRSVLARYPDDLEAWIQLGEVLFHLGPVYGRSVHASEEPWRRVLEHEPRNLFALPHLARLAALQGEVPTLDSLLTPFTPEERRTDRRLTEAELHRALAAGDTMGIRALTQEVQEWDGLAVWRVGAWLTAFSQDPSSSRAVLQKLNASHFPPEVQSDLRWFESLLRLAEGRLGPAQSALEEAIQLETRVEGAVRRAGFEPVARWYAAVLPLPYPDSTLVRMRGDLEDWNPLPLDGGKPFENVVGLGQSLLLGPLRHYALGLLSLRLGDLSGAETASRELGDLAAGGDDGFIRDLDRGLRARLLRHEGRPEAALELLEELEMGAPQGDLAVIPFVTMGTERLLLAELLAELGREAEALEWLASLGKGFVADVPLLPLSHLRRVEIQQRLGNREEAARHYQNAADMWGGADSSFLPFLERALRVERGEISERGGSWEGG